MAYSWEGKIALVTGASSGIGATVVKYLLNEDVKHVVMLDIADEAGVTLQNELNTKYKESKVTFIKCDVTDKERIIQTFNTVNKEIGYIDVVINSAGMLDDTSYAMEININLAALITSSLHAWNLMHKEKGGSGGTIINFSSIAALCSIVVVPIYSATKTAVLKFSTALGDKKIYSKSGVRVISVCFGLTETPMLNGLQKVFDNSFKEQSTEDLNALKLQSPEAAAKAVIEVYKRGESGSVWLSTSYKPVVDLTKTYDKSIELFKDYVYD